MRPFAAEFVSSDQPEAMARQTARQLDEEFGPFHVLEGARPENNAVAAGWFAGVPVATADDLRLTSKVRRAGDALRRRLRHHRIGPRQAVGIQAAIARVADERQLWHEIHVARAGENEGAPMEAGERGDQTRQRRADALVIDVGVGPAQRRPQAGQPRVEEAQPRQACGVRVHAMHLDAVDDDTVWLAEIHADHRHLPAASHELARQRALLHFGAAGERHVPVSGQQRIAERGDEAEAAWPMFGWARTGGIFHDTCPVHDAANRGLGTRACNASSTVSASAQVAA